jgi:hypothetical protein
MKITIVLLTVITFGLICGTAAAQDQPEPVKTPRVTHRQMNQQARIKQGVRSGELTKGETRRLEREQAKIQYDKKETKSDGKITPQERKHLRREQNKASRDIYRLKHNERVQK